MSVNLLRKQLERNLSAQVKDGNGPQKLIGGEFVDVLFDLLIELMSSCVGGSGKHAVKSRIKKPGWIQKSILRTRIKKRCFENSRRAYNREGGNATLAAVLQTAADANSDQVDTFVDEVDDQAPVDYYSMF